MFIFFQNIMQKLKSFSRQIKTLGLRNSLMLKVHNLRAVKIRSRGILASLKIPSLQDRLYYRPDSSDPDVIKQIFSEGGYDWLDFQPNENLTFIDCGANIGTVSAMVLSRFPNSKVIALEPSPENCQLCKKNLSGYDESRVTVLEKGVWSEENGLVVVRPDGLGLEHSHRVRVASPSEEPTVFGTSLDKLIAQFNLKKIDLLKIDVEGSEFAVFSAKNLGWLEKVRNITIELHSEECKKVFFKAMEGFKYKLEQHGEMTTLRDIQKRSVPNQVLHSESPRINLRSTSSRDFGKAFDAYFVLHADWLAANRRPYFEKELARVGVSDYQRLFIAIKSESKSLRMQPIDSWQGHFFRSLNFSGTKKTST